MYGGIRKYNYINLFVIFNYEIMILYIGSTSFEIISTIQLHFALISYFQCPE